MKIFTKEVIVEKDSRTCILTLNNDQLSDVRNILRGTYFPLKGFLREEDFKLVVSEMRLRDGSVWPIPIVIDIDEKLQSYLKTVRQIILVDMFKTVVAILKNPEIYRYDKNFFVRNVFGTINENHPGVKQVYGMKNYLIGGDISCLDSQFFHHPFKEYDLTPTETRHIFKTRNFKTVVGFQTRNIPHRGHEFLLKEVLNKFDGLFIQPIMGQKKIGDFKDEYIMASYKLLIEKYFPNQRTLLAILPMRMRYAGPREAVMHALIRRNFGCTHFIVGRDHAGVGNFYKPYEAQAIFDRFTEDELGIKILKFEEVVFCKNCKRHVFINQCVHKDKILFSGTLIRNKLKNRKKIPSYILREEIRQLLANSINPLIDDMYKKKEKTKQRGYVLWFTGLSGSGKTVIAQALEVRLKKAGFLVERLDGDIVRQSLNRDLGFSKEDRDENIRRVGFIAKLLSRNGIIVLASFVSPYRHHRDNLRKEIKDFIEVYCNCPLNVCENRDRKGLYAKARKGEIKNFTGISDVYEEPRSPEIELFTHKYSVEECVEKILDYLKKNKFI